MVDRRTVEDGSFLADGLVGSTPSVVYGTGRVCIEASCTVQLSRYNSTEWCALHESPASTQRPYDTSTRQPRGRRRNSRRRVSAPQVAADGMVMAQNAVAQNAVSQNAVSQNAVSQNAVAQNAVAQNAVAQTALSQKSQTAPTKSAPAERTKAGGKPAAKSNRKNAA